MSKVIIKKGATFPYYEAFLTTGADSKPLDLTNAKKVTVYLKGRKSKTVTTGAASIGTPATSGLVIFKWVAAIYNNVDVYDVEWEIEWNSGEIEILPNDSSTEEVEVLERVN